MPEFILNTGSADTTRAFTALDSFTQGYIEALFFTDEEQLCEESGRDMPDVAINLETMESRFLGGDSPGFTDLAPDTLARIIADCAAFQSTHAGLLEEAYGRDYGADQAGRDFWYTRNGHGVGYWDRKELEPNSAEYESLTADLKEVCATWDNPEDKAKSAAWDDIQGKRAALKRVGLGERLSDVARAFGGVDSYVGDDGKVYLM